MKRIGWVAFFLLLGLGFFISSCGGAGGGGDCTDGDQDGYFAQSGCGTAVDCNDGNATIYPNADEICDDGIDQDCSDNDLACIPELPTLESKQVSITFQALTDVGLDPTGFKISTLLNSTTIDNSEIKSDFIDADQSQIVLIEDDSGNLILVALVEKSGIALGNADLSDESIANGLIWLYLGFIGYPDDERNELLEQAKSNSNYSLLIDEIRNALLIDPMKLLEIEEFPLIYEYAWLSAHSAINSYSTKLSLKSKHAGDLLNQPFDTLPPVVGQDKQPYLSNTAGNNPAYINPTMVFYGVTINDSIPQLIAPKELAFSIFGDADEPVVEEFDIEDGGPYRFYFHKGKGSFYTGSEVARIAAWANSVKSVQIAIDIIAWCPVSNVTIEKIIERKFGNDNEIDDEIVENAISLLESYPHKFLSNTLEFIKKPRVLGAITRYLFNDINDPELAANFFVSTKKLLTNIGFVLKGYKFLQTAGPFCWDVFKKPNEITLCATVENGILTEYVGDCSRIPPVIADVSVSPKIIYPDDLVTFTVSDLYDENTPVADIQLRWDFDGDGKWDSGWSTKKETTFTYENSGAYDLVVQAGDKDDSISQHIMAILVAYSTCSDGDQDGYYSQSGCGTIADCNDKEPIIYPGAPELCDGVDNQCLGDAGYGTVDEGCQDGLIAYWSFDNDADSANDDSGNSNDLTINGASWTSSGINGGGMSFDGADDYIHIWSPSEINAEVDTNEGSVSIWFRLNELKSTYAYCYSNGAQDDRLYMSFGSSDRKMRAGLGDNSMFSDEEIIVDTWYHAVQVWNSDGNCELYINGVFDSSTDFDPNFTFKTPGEFVFGRHGDLDQRYYNGLLDEVRIYNRALSEPEISNLYNNK